MPEPVKVEPEAPVFVPEEPEDVSLSALPLPVLVSSLLPLVGLTSSSLLVWPPVLPRTLGTRTPLRGSRALNFKAGEALIKERRLRDRMAHAIREPDDADRTGQG